MLLKSPITMQMELTWGCNEACNFCYNPKRKHGGLVTIESPIPSRQKFIDRVNKIADAEVFYVTITGGEPFVRKDAIFDVVQQFSERGVDFSINSNLSLASEDDLRRLRDAGTMNILTSLPSYEKTTHRCITNSNTYDRIVENIARSGKLGIRTGVSMVVTTENKGHVYETGRFVANLGATSFYATPMSPCKEKIDDQKELLLEKDDVLAVLSDLVSLEKEYGIHTGVLEPLPHCLIFHDERLKKFLSRACVAGVSTATVGPDGNLRPCSHSTQIYGNIDDDTLQHLWAGMVEWKEQVYVPHDCKECDAVDFCLGGCRTASEAVGGNLDSVHYLMQKPLKLIRGKKYDSGIDKTVFRVPELKYRKEEGDNFVVYRSPQNTAILTGYELRMIGALKRDYKDGFSLSTLRSDLSLDESHMPFFRGMARRGIFVKGE